MLSRHARHEAQGPVLCLGTFVEEVMRVIGRPVNGRGSVRASADLRQQTSCSQGTGVAAAEAARRTALFRPGLSFDTNELEHKMEEVGRIAAASRLEARG